MLGTRHLLSFALLAWSVLGLGCFGSSQGGGGTTVVHSGSSGDSSFIVKNVSAVSVCYVNISPTAASNWGPDRLGSTETIPPDNERGWRFPSGYYDFRLQDCNRRTIMERRQLAFPANDGLVLTFRAPE